MHQNEINNQIQEIRKENQISIGDIDIDVQNRDKILNEIYHIPATRIENEVTKHNTGVYVQDIPYNPLTGYADFDYRDEDYKSCTKIDFIRFSTLDNFISNKQLCNLIDIDPDWTLLKDKEFVEGTTHIHKWYELIKNMNINSVDKLAMFLGIIRPGKEYLRNKNWKEIEEKVWSNEGEGYSFKKSHAYGYALTIVALMNLKRGR